MKALLAMLGLSVLIAPAWASDSRGFYGSVGGGAYRIDSAGFEDVAPTLKVLGGYSLNRYVAFETAYLRLFESDDRVDGNRVEIDGNVWDLSTRLGVPFGDRFEGYGRVGWSFYDLTGKTALNGNRFSIKDEEDDFTWALGAGYSLTEKVSLRAEYAQIMVDRGDADFMSFNVSYRF